jgi:hypothetical protein
MLCVMPSSSSGGPSVVVGLLWSLAAVPVVALLILAGNLFMKWYLAPGSQSWRARQRIRQIFRPLRPPKRLMPTIISTTATPCPKAVTGIVVSVTDGGNGHGGPPQALAEVVDVAARGGTFGHHDQSGGSEDDHGHGQQDEMPPVVRQQFLGPTDASGQDHLTRANLANHGSVGIRGFVLPPPTGTRNHDHRAPPPSGS